MKLSLSVTAVTLAAVMGALPAGAWALASDQDLQAVTDRAVSYMVAANDAFAADRDDDGCANLVNARNTMTQALDIIAEARAELQSDGDLSDGERRTGLDELKDQRRQFTEMRERIDVMANRNCLATRVRDARFPETPTRRDPLAMRR